MKCLPPEKGGGAFLNGKKSTFRRNDALINSLLVTGFPYNVKENPNHVVEHFVNLLMEGQGVRRLGSAALTSHMLRAGRLDGYWGSFPESVGQSCRHIVGSGGRGCCHRF